MNTCLRFVLLLTALFAGHSVCGMDTARLGSHHGPTEIARLQQIADEALIEAVKAGKGLEDFFHVNTREGERSSENTKLGTENTKLGTEHTMPNLNYQDETGKTCLHYAASCSDDNAIKYLLARGANPLIADRDRKLPVRYATGRNDVLFWPSMAQYACAQGDVGKLETILKRRIVVQDQWLFDALRSKNRGVIKLLIDHGAKPAVQPRTQDTLLHYTVQAKLPLEILHYCLELNIDVFARNKARLTALDYALRAGDTQQVTMLLPHYKGGKDETGGLLLSAIRAQINDNYVNHVMAILANFQYGDTALNVAYEQLYDICAAKLKLKELYDKPQNRRTMPPHLMQEIAVLQACKQRLADRFGHDCAVLDGQMALLRQDPDTVPVGAQIDAVNVLGVTKLLAAVKENDPDQVELLLKVGAKLQINEALFKAAAMPRKEVMCNPNMADPAAFVLEKKQKIFDLLIAYGADINAKNSDGNTLLHIAVCDSQPDAMTVLVNKYGANIYAQNNVGDTVLHCAVANDNDVMTKAIVALESQIRARMDLKTKQQYPRKLSQITNNAQKKPEDIAQQAGNTLIVEYLQRENLAGSWLLVDAPADGAEAGGTVPVDVLASWIHGSHPQEPILSTATASVATMADFVDDIETKIIPQPDIVEAAGADEFTLDRLREETEKQEPAGTDRDIVAAQQIEVEDEDVIALDDRTSVRASAQDVGIEQEKHGINAHELVPTSRARIPRIKSPIENDQQAEHFHALFASDLVTQNAVRQNDGHIDPKPPVLPVRNRALLPVVVTAVSVGLACIVAKKAYDSFYPSGADTAIKNQADDVTEQLQDTALLSQQ